MTTCVDWVLLLCPLCMPGNLPPPHIRKRQQATPPGHPPHKTTPKTGPHQANGPQPTPQTGPPNLTKGTPKHNDGPRPPTEAHTPPPPSAGQLLLQLHRTLLTASHHLTGHLLHLFQHTLTLTLGQPIHIHRAQGVIGLVLQTPRKKPRTRHHD